MALFAPGTWAGINASVDRTRQNAVDAQNKAAQKQAMDYQAWQMQQQRQQADQAQAADANAMRGMRQAPPPVAAMPQGPMPPAPGQASQPAQQAPTASPGSPPVPAYRSLAQQGQQQQPPAQPQGPSAPPPVQSAQPQQQGYSLESVMANLDRAGLSDADQFRALQKAMPFIQESDRQRAAQLAQQKEALAERKLTESEAQRAPQMRTRVDGTQEVQEQWNPATKSWDKIGSGPRFAKQVGGTAPAGGAPTGSSSKLTGEALLASLKPGEANMVKAISEGRLPLSAVGYKDKTRIGELVAAYKGDYDAATYPTRQAVVKDFTSGPTAKNITALNTGIGHLGTLSELGKALKTGDVKALNGAYNKISSEFGVANVNNFEIARDAVANEMVRIFRQVGSSDAETAKWESTFKSSASPEQMSGSIKTAVDLLGSRLSALNEQWNRGTGETEGFKNILDPKSKKVLESMGVSTGKPAAQGAVPYSDADKEARYQAWKKQHAGQ